MSGLLATVDTTLRRILLSEEHMDKMTLDLVFIDKDLGETYSQYAYEHHKTAYRRFITLGVILYALFGITDIGTYSGQQFTDLLLARGTFCLVIGPAYLAFIYSPLLKPYYRHVQMTIMFTCIFCTQVIVLIRRTEYFVGTSFWLVAWIFQALSRLEVRDMALIYTATFLSTRALVLIVGLFYRYDTFTWDIFISVSAQDAINYGSGAVTAFFILVAERRDFLTITAAYERLLGANTERVQHLEQCCGYDVAAIFQSHAADPAPFPMPVLALSLQPETASLDHISATDNACTGTENPVATALSELCAENDIQVWRQYGDRVLIAAPVSSFLDYLDHQDDISEPFYNTAAQLIIQLALNLHSIVGPRNDVQVTLNINVADLAHVRCGVQEYMGGRISGPAVHNAIHNVLSDHDSFPIRVLARDQLAANSILSVFTQYASYHTIDPALSTNPSSSVLLALDPSSGAILSRRNSVTPSRRGSITPSRRGSQSSVHTPTALPGRPDSPSNFLRRVSDHRKSTDIMRISADSVQSPFTPHHDTGNPISLPRRVSSSSNNHSPAHSPERTGHRDKHSPAGPASLLLDEPQSPLTPTGIPSTARRFSVALGSADHDVTSTPANAFSAVDRLASMSRDTDKRKRRHKNNSAKYKVSLDLKQRLSSVARFDQDDLDSLDDDSLCGPWWVWYTSDLQPMHTGYAELLNKIAKQLPRRRTSLRYTDPRLESDFNQDLANNSFRVLQIAITVYMLLQVFLVLYDVTIHPELTDQMAFFRVTVFTLTTAGLLAFMRSTYFPTRMQSTLLISFLIFGAAQITLSLLVPEKEMENYQVMSERFVMHLSNFSYLHLHNIRLVDGILLIYVAGIMYVRGYTTLLLRVFELALLMVLFLEGGRIIEESRRRQFTVHQLTRLTASEQEFLRKEHSLSSLRNGSRNRPRSDSALSSRALSHSGSSAALSFSALSGPEYDVVRLVGSEAGSAFTPVPPSSDLQNDDDTQGIQRFAYSMLISAELIPAAERLIGIPSPFTRISIAHAVMDIISATRAASKVTLHTSTKPDGTIIVYTEPSFEPPARHRDTLLSIANQVLQIVPREHRARVALTGPVVAISYGSCDVSTNPMDVYNFEALNVSGEAIDTLLDGWYLRPEWMQTIDSGALLLCSEWLIDEAARLGQYLVEQRQSFADPPEDGHFSMSNIQYWRTRVDKRRQTQDAHQEVLQQVSQRLPLLNWGLLRRMVTSWVFATPDFQGALRTAEVRTITMHKAIMRWTRPATSASMFCLALYLLGAQLFTGSALPSNTVAWINVAAAGVALLSAIICSVFTSHLTWHVYIGLQALVGVACILVPAVASGPSITTIMLFIVGVSTCAHVSQFFALAWLVADLVWLGVESYSHLQDLTNLYILVGDIVSALVITVVAVWCNGLRLASLLERICFMGDDEEEDDEQEHNDAGTDSSVTQTTSHNPPKLRVRLSSGPNTAQESFRTFVGRRLGTSYRNVLFAILVLSMLVLVRQLEYITKRPEASQEVMQQVVALTIFTVLPATSFAYVATYLPQLHDSISKFGDAVLCALLLCVSGVSWIINDPTIQGLSGGNELSVFVLLLLGFGMHGGSEVLVLGVLSLAVTVLSAIFTLSGWLPVVECVASFVVGGLISREIVRLRKVSFQRKP